MKRPSTQRTETAAALGRWRTKVETAFGREVGRRTIAPDARESIFGFLSSPLSFLRYFPSQWEIQTAVCDSSSSSRSREAEGDFPSLSERKTAEAREGEKKQRIAGVIRSKTKHKPKKF